MYGASIDIAVPAGGLWLNNHDSNQKKHLTVECAQEVRTYLRSNLTQELGCLIRQYGEGQFEVIPFENGDPTMATIKMISDADFVRMLDLYKIGELWGWFHSHPGGSPYPSMTDLTQHRLQVNMGIYGGVSDTVSIFSTRDLDIILGQRVQMAASTMESIACEVTNA